MAKREVNRLSAKTITSKLDAGYHADGNGLYLAVQASGSKSWILRYRVGSKRREKGLGSASTVSLKDARELAAENRRLLAKDIDPIEIAKAEIQKSKTFEDFAVEFLAGKESGFRNAKHFAQWRSTLKTYASNLNALPLNDIKTEHVLAALRPIWTKIPETASRVRGRIEAILDGARALGLTVEDKPNPARWKGHLDHLLPKRAKLDSSHHAALAYDDLPAFFAELRTRKGVAPIALEFAILAGGRTGEVVGAKWDEINFDEKLWIVPRERMKAGREHRVPLSTRALEILEGQRHGFKSEFVFAVKSLESLSNMSLLEVLKRMGRNGVAARKKGRHITTHGFRSTFRDWCGDKTEFAREVIEAALAHAVGNKAEQAYRRSDALEKRRVLMQSWCDYCQQANEKPFS